LRISEVAHRDIASRERIHLGLIFVENLQSLWSELAQVSLWIRHLHRLLGHLLLHCFELIL
jgi:hypothetical protein